WVCLHIRLAARAPVVYWQAMKSKCTLLLCTAATWIFAAASVNAEVLDKMTNIGGSSVRYKVILPNKYDAAKAYPGVLAFGGGPQTIEMVDNTIRRFWRQQAEERGYLVVLPAAPNGDLFFEGGE